MKKKLYRMVLGKHTRKSNMKWTFGFHRNVLKDGMKMAFVTPTPMIRALQEAHDGHTLLCGIGLTKLCHDDGGKHQLVPPKPLHLPR